MKIGALTDILQSMNIVRERKGGDTPDRHPGGERRQQENKDQREKPSREELQGAAAAFTADSQAQANGLSADVIEAGPGLKVVLRDGHGKVLRELGGEEFLRMREGVTTEPRARGKILDQKL